MTVRTPALTDSAASPGGGRIRPTGSRESGERRTRLVVNAIMIVVFATFALPLTWLILASIDPQATNRSAVPSGVTLDNFAQVFTYDTFVRPAMNSLVISSGVAVIALVVAVLASYPLSRYGLRFGRSFMLSVLFGTCLPITAIMVPVYSLFVALNLLNSIPAMILFLAATALPTAIWMTKNFMDSVPIELEEAAWVDGASRLRALWTVVVPLMRPGLGVVFIFVFIDAWANFFAPFILLISPDNQPLSVSIYSFFGARGIIQYGQLAAFSILYATPVLALYLIVSKGLGGSFALSGAVKG